MTLRPTDRARSCDILRYRTPIMKNNLLNTLSLNELWKQNSRRYTVSAPPLFQNSRVFRILEDSIILRRDDISRNLRPLFSAN